MASALKSTSPAKTAATPGVPFDPTTAKVVKHVTVPQLKLKVGDTVYVKVEKAIELAKPQKNAKPDADGKVKKPPHIMQVTNLETGELRSIILGTTAVDTFNEEYPSASYVGKGFKIVVAEQKQSQGGGGQRYNTYEITEIELPE